MDKSNEVLIALLAVKELEIRNLKDKIDNLEDQALIYMEKNDELYYVISQIGNNQPSMN